MFYHCPHRTQAINGYHAQQAEEEHQLEEGQNQAVWDEYWSEKETQSKYSVSKKMKFYCYINKLSNYAS